MSSTRRFARRRHRLRTAFSMRLDAGSSGGGTAAGEFGSRSRHLCAPVWRNCRRRVSPIPTWRFTSDKIPATRAATSWRVCVLWSWPTSRAQAGGQWAGDSVSRQLAVVWIMPAGGGGFPVGDARRGRDAAASVAEDYRLLQRGGISGARTATRGAGGDE